MKLKKVWCILVCVFSPSLALSETITNKTFLTPRPYAFSQPYEFSMWHRHVLGNRTQRSGVGFQIAGFTRLSTNNRGLANYFGAIASDSLTAGVNVGTLNSTVFTIDSRSLIHHAVSPLQPSLSTNIAGIIKINPRQTIYGASCLLRQELDVLITGLYLQVHLPVTNTHTTMHLTVDSAQNDSTLNVSLEDYFAGKVTQPAGANQQAALTSALMDGGHDRTEASDIKVSLGQIVAEDTFYRAELGVSLTIPVQSKQNGVALFEPVSGFVGHFSFAGEANITYNLIRSNHTSVDLTSMLSYRYVFSDQEIRTLRFRRANATTESWDSYYLGGEIGQNGVFPLANVLTRDVHVTPSSQTEYLFALSLHTQCYTIDLGYNLFARSGEKVSVAMWPENTYAFADSSYNALDPFGAGLGTTAPNDDFNMSIDGFITKDRLDVQACASPATLSHSLFIAIGRLLAPTKGTPSCSISLGASYEFADNNTLIEGAFFWTKVGLLF